MLVILQQLHSLSETFLSDKECSRIDDVQEVPEATVEGCLCSIFFLPSKFSLAHLLSPLLASPGSLQLWKQSEGLRRNN